MVFDDIRHAWRRIRSKPATVIGAAAMLALGIALTTAMFTIADTLLLRPVPFDDPERLARVSMMGPRGGRIAVSPAVFLAWQSSAAFSAVESATTSTSVLETSGGPIARATAAVTPGLFQMLGVRPIRGRAFDMQDGRPGTTDRVVISEDLWRSAFSADPQLVGRTIVVDGQSVHVAGILPADFRFPQWDTVMWRPIQFESSSLASGADAPIAFVRFAAGVPQSDALRLASDAAHAADPSTATLAAQADAMAGVRLNRYYAQAVPLLFGGVALVFLVLCANASSLLLVRLTERRREFSMCAALGASRGRLLRQALIESSMLGAIGAVGGLALAAALLAVARGFLPEAFLLRTLNPLNMDTRALAAACAGGALATLVTGIWPAWLGTRRISADSLKTGDRGFTESRTTQLVARGLVVAETAFACMLMVGAVLLVRSFVNLAQTDRGLDTSGVVIARISLPRTAFADAAARSAMTSAIETEVKGLHGVEEAALSFGLPPDGGAFHTYEWRSDLPREAGTMTVESYDVGSDFFELYRIPLVRGRGFQPADTRNDVIVGERLASSLWPGIDPIGRSFSYGKQQHRVVGVAREIHHPSIDPRVDRPEFYQPLSAAARSGGQFMMSLRCRQTCPDGAVIRQRLRGISPAINVVDVGPLEAEYFEQLAGPRAAAALGFTFAAVGVVAAAGGLFGVLSYVVGRRRREFGVRVALGASQPQLRRLVLRDGIVVGVAGLALGSFGGWWLARGLSSLQYGVSAADPVSWALVIGVLVITTLVTTWPPARSAARTDPALLLREE
jgi:putative ABC transport system permease protein